MGSKGITCEGLPTGRTELVRDGVLVGLLTNRYERQRLLHDPAGPRKLGADAPAAAAALVPRNGFRYAGLGRSFDSAPGIAASDVLVEGRRPRPTAELIRAVGEGLYVGRIWYTYPINGLAAGDFTCTVVGDSFIIRDGRLAAPRSANALRIDDNVLRVVGHVAGVGAEPSGTVAWAADEVIYAPAIACTGVHVDAVADAMEASS
jgi:PmbA protein